MLFDRFDAPLGELSPNDVFELMRREAINGEHSLAITTTRVLQNGWRVLCQDAMGKWREYVVYGTDALHETGERAFGSYYCVWSMQHDLMGTRISKMPGVQTPVVAGAALEDVLDGTGRWGVGTVTNTNTGGASMYDTDGWKAMSTLIKVWGGEVDTTINVGSTGVTGRLVDLYDKQGEQDAKRRFDFGADLTSVRRIVADGPLYCRLSPRGKGEQTESGGYGRKITIEDVNDGKDYLENAQMVDLAKLPDGSGGWEYPTLIVENSSCETPAELKEWGLSVLDDYTLPRVTYEVDVMQLSAEGVDMRGVALGDAVQVVDRKWDGLRLTGRIVEMAVDELNDREVSVKIGSLQNGLSDTFNDLSSRIDSVSESLAALGHTMSTAAYIDALLDRINAEINATGGYAYIVPGHGILTFDVAVADPLNPTEAHQVVEVKGGTIRIANSRTAQGEWEWHTVFVSGHIAADLVTAAHLTTGYIGNSGGSYWDLDNDVLQIANTSRVGTRTVADLLSTVDGTITDVDTDIEYAKSTSSDTAPQSGWSTDSPTWEQGYYIWQRTKNTVTTAQGDTTTYSEPVCISGRDGATGVGISSTTIRYGTSASASAQPTNWSASVPTTLAQGTWLWTRIVYDYTDGSTETVYSKSYMGSDGTSVTILGSYNTLAELQAAHPMGNLGDGYIVSGDLYIWNGSAWENVGTIQGPQGNPGTSVTVTSVQYGTSASASTQPTNWSTTSPTSITKGQWLWVKTTFSDGTTATSKSYAGTDGAAAVTYSITSSVDAVIRQENGVSVPSSVTFNATSKTGNGASSAYAGRIYVEWSADGTTWNEKYNPSSNQSSYTTTVNSGAKFLRALLYAAGGKTTLLDTQTVAVVSNGGTGADAYTVVLSNESHTFPGDATKAIASSTTCSVIAYKGTSRIAATIGTISGKPTGMTTSITNNGTTSAYFTVSVTTSMTTRNGTLTIPLTIDGKSFTATFSYALALKGATGKGVSAIVEQYYLSTSSSQQTGGSWSTTQPEWVQGKYIWTRSKVTWDDSTETTTAPILAGALNSANEKAEEAAKVATNYLAYDASKGLDVGYSGTDAKTRINGAGMEVFGGDGVSAAFFGIDGNSNSYARVGNQSDGQGNVEIESESTADSMSINLNNGQDTLAQIAYGRIHRYGVSTVYRGPFFTFGDRKSDGSYFPGYTSFATGESNIVRGTDSFGGGYDNEVTGDYAFCYGYHNEVRFRDNSTFGGHAIGHHLTVLGQYLACGAYNYYNNNSYINYARFIVGGGTNGNPLNAMVVYNDGDVTILGTLTQSSDRRLKEHVEYLSDDAAQFVRDLKPALFKMKSNGTRRLGFYAQDVRDAEPEGWDTETVSEDGMSSELPDALALDYTALIAPLVAYAHQLEARIEQLEARLSALEGEK